jgi:hypothetical protein
MIQAANRGRCTLIIWPIFGTRLISFTGSFKGGDPPPFFFNSSLLWDVFSINSVEQLQTLPKTQSEIDISPFLKTQKPSILYSINRVEDRGFFVFRNGLISISDWVFGNVWSCLKLYIMKTSHRSDELKKN